MPEISDQEAPPLDYSLLLQTYMAALTWHDFTELEMLVAMKVALGAFGIGRPFAWIQRKTELAKLIAKRRDKTGLVLDKLAEQKAVEVSRVHDGWIVTPVPPSAAWPWKRKSRFAHLAEEAEVRRLEKELALVTRNWPRDRVLFGPGPEVEVEFQQALAIERMRESLLAAHRAAAAGFAGAEGAEGAETFPVKDRESEKGPAVVAASTRKDITRPPDGEVDANPDPSATSPNLGGEEESRGDGGFTEEQLRAMRELVARQMGVEVPQGVPFLGTNSGEGGENGSGAGPEFVPEKGTNEAIIPEKGTDLYPKKVQPFKALMSSEEDNFKALKEEPAARFVPKKGTRPAKTAGSPLPQAVLDSIRGAMTPDHLRPLAETTEKGVMAWLVYALGQPIMAQWGGWWRKRFRQEPAAVIETCDRIRRRVNDPDIDTLQNRGGWGRDELGRVRKHLAEVALKKTQNPN